MYTINTDTFIGLITDLNGYKFDKRYEMFDTVLYEPRTDYGYKRVSLNGKRFSPVNSRVKALYKSISGNDDGYVKVKNSEKICFPEATGDWGNIEAFALITYDSGEVVFGNIGGRTLNKGDTACFNKGDMSINIHTYASCFPHKNMGVSL